MNNLVFNTVASELKTTIFAQAPGDLTKALKMDASDNLLVSVASGTVVVSEITAPVEISNDSLTVAGSVTVAGTVTVSEITAPVEISNDSLTVAGSVTVAGTVTVSEITAPVEISNDSLTVAGSVTVAGTVTVSEITAPVEISNDSLTVAGSVTVAGTVTVSEITAPVEISNDSLTVAGSVTVAGTVTIGASSFTADMVTSTVVTGTGIVFPDTDISTLKVGSIFLYNEGAIPVTLSLQISPTTDESNYINDPFYTNQVIGANGSLYMSVSNFAHYIRLQYNLGGATATFSAYFNGQA